MDFVQELQKLNTSEAEYAGTLNILNTEITPGNQVYMYIGNIGLVPTTVTKSEKPIITHSADNYFLEYSVESAKNVVETKLSNIKSMIKAIKSVYMPEPYFDDEQLNEINKQAAPKLDKVPKKIISSSKKATTSIAITEHHTDITQEHKETPSARRKNVSKFAMKHEGISL